jgi:hypothetical protein
LLSNARKAAANNSIFISDESPSLGSHTKIAAEYRNSFLGGSILDLDPAFPLIWNQDPDFYPACFQKAIA